MWIDFTRSRRNLPAAYCPEHDETWDATCPECAKVDEFTIIRKNVEIQLLNDILE